MRIFHVLLLLFIGVPLLELWFLIKVGGVVGALPTIFLVVFTAVLGALLMRHQGFTTVQRAQMTMQRGESPTVEMLEGVVVLFSGGLLLVPGFFTDALGFLGLVGPLRRALILKLLERSVIQPMGGVPPYRPPYGPDDPSREGHRPRTLEGDYRRDDD